MYARVIAVVMVLVACFGEGAWAEPPAASEERALQPTVPAAYAPTATVAGAMTIAGSDSMKPILLKLAREFHLWHPQAKLVVSGSDPELLERFLNGISGARRGDGDETGHLGSQAAQILAVSRELTKAELQQFTERFGYRPTAIPIAQDAVAVYVNRENPIQSLTLEQLDAIFSSSRNRGAPDQIDRWGQVGLNGSYAEAPVRLYGRDKRSAGTRPFFKEHALMSGEFRLDVQEEPGSASVVLSVARDPYGIGYSSIGFHTKSVKIVPLAAKEGMPPVDPTKDSVVRGMYPLARRVYLYVNQPPDQPMKPLILEFLTFVVSQRGQATIASAGVYPYISPAAVKNLQTLALADGAGVDRTKK